MASLLQMLTNRSNSQASTGPSTPAGKARAASNSLKHGLSGSFSVLSHESCEDFDQLLQDLHSEFTPAGSHENFLVQQMAEARWNLARARRLEAASLNRMITSESDNPDDYDYAIVANMMLNGSDVLAVLIRYAASHERSFYKAVAELRRVRAHPLGGPASSGANVEAPTPAPVASSPNRDLASFRNEDTPTARNALCPCASGKKYKRCCGAGAPPLLSAA